MNPANASPARPFNLIDLGLAPSGMEQAAEKWRGSGPAPVAPLEERRRAAGEAWCQYGTRHGSRGGGPVPAWFGQKCIEGNCPLRGKDAA